MWLFLAWLAVRLCSVMKLSLLSPQHTFDSVIESVGWLLLGRVNKHLSYPSKGAEEMLKKWFCPWLDWQTNENIGVTYSRADKREVPSRNMGDVCNCMTEKPSWHVWWLMKSHGWSSLTNGQVYPLDDFLDWCWTSYITLGTDLSSLVTSWAFWAS